MKQLTLIIVSTTIILSCSKSPNYELREQWKGEIVQTEKDFSNMSVKEGVPKAFLAYAAADAVLKRGSTLVVGLQEMKKRFENQDLSTTILEWEPDFVDVSSSGDLGYTYGHYTATSIDSLGIKQESTGVFHTVWRRQDDGKWKFVWD
jgi:ketosteroid isomerase-like protein